ncbi:hypothetical protein NUH88_05465 [Nisaea acidiphila]|uniref:Uncharacterized protein n=1 Tax=Nisaea acidiphila TaxID=1862145 RepID=A0A9J7AXH7_9PROT|nr:hypothetical protein [Nisaea acidiphila]UUX51137.1 hypothetical protein NUH88_05465 [Nisaea acidiphila]
MRDLILRFLGVFKLLLPALFPSWRFFDVIGPSPRVEYCLLKTPHDETADWHECRPRPARLSFRDRLISFFWNAAWNETLFYANCAERLIQGQTEHCTRELRRRLRADILSGSAGEAASPFFRFRLVFVSRFEGAVRRDVAFVSPAVQTVDPADR